MVNDKSSPRWMDVRQLSKDCSTTPLSESACKIVRDQGGRQHEPKLIQLRACELSWIVARCHQAGLGCSAGIGLVYIGVVMKSRVPNRPGHPQLLAALDRKQNFSSSMPTGKHNGRLLLVYFSIPPQKCRSKSGVRPCCKTSSTQ